MASDDSIYVNYGQVTNVEEVLQDGTKQIEALLDNLNQQIQPLRATWAGVSDEEYNQVQARWNNDVGQMSSILVRYAGTLSNMQYNYSNTDSNLAFQWASIQ
jgi:WXG100 family type VII secretion target